MDLIIEQGDKKRTSWIWVRNMEGGKLTAHGENWSMCSILGREVEAEAVVNVTLQVEDKMILGKKKSGQGRPINLDH